MPLSPGTRLGPYEILSALGAGGMGEVYKARDTRLGRTVAIKILAREHAERFETEARAIASLNHPHICVLHDIGPDYLVMEYVEGTPLQGPLPLDAVLRAATELVDALDTAHAKGVLHRDIKPANILMTSTGTKLLDFGLARIAAMPGDDVTQTVGLVAGTAAYMSPEQAQGLPVDARSDVFAIGAVIYELVSGKRVFERASLLDTLNAVVREEPPAIASPASAVIKRCLAKQPAQRFQSMAELKTALEHLRTHRSADLTPSIAVLPFANMSRDPDDEYFSDGLAEEIINALAQVPQLKVIARTSAFAFKGKNEDIRRIAETLGVTHILEGSVRRAGSRVRVTAQLILATDGTHLWSQRYDRDMEDVFGVQDEIATAIADALKLKLIRTHERRMPTIPAYEAYLRYRSYQWQFTPEASRRSRECLEQALTLDPGFALPYVGLADYHLALAAVGAEAPGDAMPRARDLATRALELDPELPEAHAMLGIIAGHYDYDWREAERRFDQATCHPSMSPHLRSWYSTFLLQSTGRLAEALVQSTRVIDEDPLCQMWHAMRANTLCSLGRTQDGLAALRRTLELDPHFWFGWAQVALLAAIAGDHVEAMQSAQTAMAAAPWSPYSMGVMAGVLELQGEPERAAALLDDLRRRPHDQGVGLMCYYLARGDTELAVEWVRKAATHRFPAFIPVWVRAFEPLMAQSAGWPAALQALHLTPAAGKGR